MGLLVPASGQDISSSTSPYDLQTVPRRTLGCAVLLAAISDYLSGDCTAHRTAEAFLYPKTADYAERYEWAVSMAPGINPAWLRRMLDRRKALWDELWFESVLQFHQKSAHTPGPPHRLLSDDAL